MSYYRGNKKNKEENKMDTRSNFRKKRQNSQ